MVWIFLVQVLLSVSYKEDGTVDKENKNNKYIDKVVHVDTKGNVQGFEYIPMESDFKTGTLLKIEYQIKVTNNSEVDWTGKLASYETSQEVLDKVLELEKSTPYVSVLVLLLLMDFHLLILIIEHFSFHL